MSQLRTLLSIAIFLAMIENHASAQSYRYIDEAGNIHFVDSLQDVPTRFKSQIPGWSPPPEGTPDKRALKSKQKDIEREREKRDKERKKAEEKKRKEWIKQTKRNQKMLSRKQGEAKVEPRQNLVPRREDDTLPAVPVATAPTAIPGLPPSFELPPQGEAP